MKHDSRDGFRIVKDKEYGVYNVSRRIGVVWSEPLAGYCSFEAALRFLGTFVKCDNVEFSVEYPDD